MLSYLLIFSKEPKDDRDSRSDKFLLWVLNIFDVDDRPFVQLKSGLFLSRLIVENDLARPLILR